MPPKSSASSDPFIVSTSLDKPDAGTRKFIRSHVMRGKNTRKARQGKAMIHDNTQRQQKKKEDVYWLLMPPRKIASELSLFGYVEEMKPYMFDLISKAFTLVKPSTYTVEIVLVDGPKKDMFCFPDLPRHPALLHSILFTSQAFWDRSRGLQYGKVAQLHLAKTLYHLQKSLCDSHEATVDSTFIVVLSLATAAAILGDFDTVEKHMSGLYRMVELRGGVGAFGKGSMIEHKARRLDFGLALSTGNKPRYMDEDFSWGPQVAHGVDVSRLPELSMLSPRPDPRLLNVWADLRVFTKAANDATATGVKLPQDFFIKVGSSVPSRLLALQFAPTSLPELLRLCMLASMKSILIQIDGLGPRLRHLADSLKDALAAQQFPPEPEFAKLMLWALFIATVAIFESFHQDWLRFAVAQIVASLGCATWAETRAILKEFLWIDMVYEKPGKKLFDQLLDVGGQ